MKHALMALIFGCFTFGGAASPLTQAEQQAWLEDIDFYVQQVKTQHIQPFHTLAEADFNLRVERLKTQLPVLTEAQVETRLMTISRAISDGHSNYFMMSGPHQHFPFRYKFFGDTLRVIDTTPKYRNLLGAQLSSINGVSVAELYAQLSATLPGVDNQYSEKTSFEYYLSLHKLLLGLEIVAEGQSALFKFGTGKEEVSVQVSPVSMSEFGKLSSAYSRTEPELTAQSIGMPGITLSLLRQHKAAYFAFTSYPKLEQIIAHCEDLQATLKAAGSRVIIIDFRGNGGGNFYSGLALSACLQSLDQIDWMQGVYVLSDGETFSAAMTNTVQFRQILNATVLAPQPEETQISFQKIACSRCQTRGVGSACRNGTIHFQTYKVMPCIRTYI